MNPKQITLLAVLVAIAGGVYFVVNRKHEEGINTEEVAKIGGPAIRSFNVPDVTDFTISQKNLSVTLKKEDGEWVVSERDDYLADANKVRGLLYTIKDLEIAESRNSKSKAALKELQLLTPDESGQGGSGAGTVVSISAGPESREIIFGANFDSSGQNGRFIKNTAGDIYIVTTPLRNLETKASAWLNKEFFRIQKSEQVTITHQDDAESFTVFRESEGSPLALEGATGDEELNTTEGDRLGNLLSSAQFADYVAGDAAKPENTGLDKPTTATIKTFDNFTYVVKLGKKNNEGKFYVSYDVSADLPEPPAEEEPASEDEELTAEQTAAKAARDQKRSELKRLSEKLEREKKFAGKVYLMDSFLVESITKKRSEILKTEADRKKEAEEAAKRAAAPPGLGANMMQGGSPNIIATGPNGEQRMTATTPPVALDPESQKLADEERKKQEALAKEKFEADQTSAAIKEIIKDAKKKKSEAKKEAKEN